jgi:hypothetical protein
MRYGPQQPRYRRQRSHKHFSALPLLTSEKTTAYCSLIQVANALKIPSSPSILADANSSFGGHRRSCCCCVFFFFLWGRRVSTASCQASDSCPSMHAAAASSCCCAAADDADADVRYVFFTLPFSTLIAHLAAIEEAAAASSSSSSVPTSSCCGCSQLAFDSYKKKTK